MRTRIILIMALLGLGGGIATVLATTDGAARSSGPINLVVAGFYPLAYAAQQLLPQAEVINLTPPGVEPHDLELDAGDAREVESADLVLLMGRGFQPQLEQAAEQGGGVVVKVLDAPGVRARAGDPHVWLDPVRYEAIVRRIATALGRPRAASAMLTRLHRLDGAFEAGLAHCRRDEIVTSHAAFGYLAGRYGLLQVAVSGLTPETEPSPGTLADVVRTVRDSGATTVFAERLASPRLADTVARETGARTAILDPLEGLTAREAERGEDYFTVMRGNLRALRAGLGCR